MFQIPPSVLAQSQAATVIQKKENCGCGGDCCKEGQEETPTLLHSVKDGVIAGLSAAIVGIIFVKFLGNKR